MPSFLLEFLPDYAVFFIENFKMNDIIFVFGVVFGIMIAFATIRLIFLVGLWFVSVVRIAKGRILHGGFTGEKIASRCDAKAEFSETQVSLL